MIGEVCVLQVGGTVDMLTGHILESAIESATRKAPASLIVDLTDVEFLASKGMSALMGAHNELTPDIRLVVVADGPATSRPLKLIGIAEFIDLYSTLEDALAAVTS